MSLKFSHTYPDGRVVTVEYSKCYFHVREEGNGAGWDHSYHDRIELKPPDYDYDIGHDAFDAYCKDVVERHSSPLLTE